MTRCGHCGQEHPTGTAICPVTGDALAAPGLIGQRLDRYQVESLLGSGGFGAVYRAVHVHTDARVALKVLKPSVSADPTIVERFLREAKAAAAVGSDHIVRVLDAGVAQPSGQAFLAMELLDGCDLRELARRTGGLAPARLVLIVGQVLEGLGAAHAKGIVHRDMKPANVFVSRKVDDHGVERDAVRLLDFGISKMHGDGATSGLTVTGIAMGTPSYMAPEQFFDARSVDARADLYSVAVMLYELLSGRLPFEADSYAALIVKVKTEPPPPLMQVAPTLAPALAQAVMVGLAKEKEHRWASAQEFHQALRAAAGMPARPSAQPTPLPPAAAGATPSRPGLDTPSMLHGKTAVPTPLQQPGGPATPAAAHVQSATGEPSLPSAPPGLAAPPTPAALPTPAAQPGGAPPAAVTTQPPTAPPPPKGSGPSRTLLIVGGVIALLTGCCVCTGILGAIGQNGANARKAPHPAPNDPPADGLPFHFGGPPEPTEPEPPAEPDGEPPPAAEADAPPPPAIELERALQQAAKEIERATRGNAPPEPPPARGKKKR